MSAGRGYSVQVQICFRIRLLFRKNLVGLRTFFLWRWGGVWREMAILQIALSFFFFLFFYVPYLLCAARGSLASVVRGPRTWFWFWNESALLAKSLVLCADGLADRLEEF